MDDVTALRDALVLQYNATAEPSEYGAQEFEADLDALIAAVEARAAITPERLTVEAPTWLREMVQSIHAACSLSLDDPDEWPNALRDIKGWCAEALAALSAPEPSSGAAPVEERESDEPPLGFIVWRAWFEGMESQGRHVEPRRRSWETLSEQDHDLDAAIETRVATWVLDRHRRLFPCAPRSAGAGDGRTDR